MKRLFILAIVSMLVTFSYSQVYQFKSDSIAIVKFDSSNKSLNPSLRASNHVISIDCSTGYLTISGQLKSGVLIAKAFKPSKSDLKSYNEFYNNFYKGLKLY